MLFFDRGLLSMGNILFLSGVTTTIGPRRTYKFFKRNGKGTAAFMSGVALVFVGWPFFGMLVEGYGFLVLFSSFFPTVLLFLKRLPVVGTFLSLPGVRTSSRRSWGRRRPCRCERARGRAALQKGAEGENRRARFTGT